MSRLVTALGDIDTLDRLAAQDSPVHRLDPRAKVLTTAMLVLTVVSFPKYEVAELLPLLLYPAAILVASAVPSRTVLRYVLLASPFALLVGVFNIFLDRQTVSQWGPWAVSGGWLSFLSILIRFLLTVSAALVLLASTGYVAVCAALNHFGLPRLLVMQFLLLYRFIFVLADEAARMVRARDLRSCGQRRTVIGHWASLAGHLLLRAYDRGQRVHAAMLARGFSGTLHPRRMMHWSVGDTCFVAGWAAFFLLIRLAQVAERLGQWTMEVLG